MLFIQKNENDILLDVHVQPKASKCRLSGIYDNALKICVTAPPVDGKANTAVIAFFADLFHLPKYAITIASGQQGRRKRIRITGMNFKTARDTLEKILAGEKIIK